ncbi:MAG: hypothetical protein ACFB6S_13475 [Geminicoccaceae bacterium]
MKQGALLVEQSIDGYRPLGAFGQPVHNSYVQLRAAVAQRLDERCANLFARPQFDERSQKIRWIAPVAGDARSWNDLAPQEQAERALDLKIIRGQFDNYLSELRTNGGNGGGEAFASVLDQALKTPNDRHLHFIDDQPVMTFWGFAEQGGGTFDPLTALPPAAAAAETPRAEPEEAVSSTRRWPLWLWWLLPLLLLLALLLWWFFWREPSVEAPLNETLQEEAPLPLEEPRPPDPANVIERPVIRDFTGQIIPPEQVTVDAEGRVVGPDGEVIEGVTPEELGLVAEDGELGAAPEDLVTDEGLVGEEGLGEAELPPGEDQALGEDEALSGEEQPQTEGEEPLGEDPSAAGEEPPVPGEEPETPGEEPPAPEEGAAPEDEPPAGDEPAEEPAGADEPAGPEGEPEQPPAEPGEPLSLPPDPPTPGDQAGGAQGGPASVEFLQGQWRSRSALTDEQGNQLDQTYEFGADGQGQSVIRRADGTRCVAPAEARMQDGKLTISEKDNPTCADGQKFEKSETVCEVDASGQTRCSGDGFDVQMERAGP